MWNGNCAVYKGYTKYDKILYGDLHYVSWCVVVLNLRGVVD